MTVAKRFLYSKIQESTVAQPVERATPGEEVVGSIPAVAARSLLVGSVSVMVSLLCLVCDCT